MSNPALLERIANALDLDVEAFEGLSDQPPTDQREGQEADWGLVIEIRRLVAAFCALPTREARRQAIRSVELLASDCIAGATEQTGNLE